MSKQHTKAATHEKMIHEYGTEVDHKHNKDHLEYKEKESQLHHHLHGGHTVHKPSHHHHKTAHHHTHQHTDGDK